MTEPPFGMLAELTYACPLQCPYCSNPLNLNDYGDELTTAQWRQLFTEARDLGVLQAHFSGGEPLLRRDITDLVGHAHDLGIYTNLVTSGVALSPRRAERLRAAGLDHVQISIQDGEAAANDRIAGIRSFQRKLAAARLIKDLGWPLTVNVVLHRRNIDHLDRIIDIAEELRADRLELANTQYYGWALRNRAGLLPSREQLARAEATVRAARVRLAGRAEVLYVLPDYYGDRPKPCMGGWGRRLFAVTPNGDVLPCLAAHALPLPRASVHEHPLAWIWQHSPVFRAFRGTDWLPQPCRDCALREVDFGGCRCQAFQLTGDAARTDPVCGLSPDHGLITAAVRAANEPSADAVLVPRRPE